MSMRCRFSSIQTMAFTHGLTTVGECHPYREFEGMQPSNINYKLKFVSKCNGRKPVGICFSPKPSGALGSYGIHDTRSTEQVMDLVSDLTGLRNVCAQDDMVTRKRRLI